jgi:hypothetical protein
VPSVVVHPDGQFNIEDVMSFVVLGNWYLSNYGLVASSQPASGPEITYKIEKDSIRITLPEGIKAYDMQLIYEPGIFSAEFQGSDDRIAIVQNDREQGVFNLIAESENSNIVSISYDLKDKVTRVQLFVQAYGAGGDIVSNILESIEINAIPDEFVISQNYPNPFNPVTRIEYGLPVLSQVRLSIYDLLGREVITLVDGVQEAGYRSVSWHGNNHTGNGVGAGMYFYVIQAGDFRQVRKMILLK